MMNIDLIIEAAVGGIIGLLFWRIQRKIDNLETEQAGRHEQLVKMRTAERELLIAEANISALTAMCVRGDKVNGELEAAEKTLLEKEKALQDLTQKHAIEYIENT